VPDFTSIDFTPELDIRCASVITKWFGGAKFLVCKYDEAGAVGPNERFTAVSWHRTMGAARKARQHPSLYGNGVVVVFKTAEDAKTLAETTPSSARRC
jgi:hypothetical protein